MQWALYNVMAQSRKDNSVRTWSRSLSEQVCKVHRCIISDLMKYFWILVFALMFLECVLAVISDDPSDVGNSRRAWTESILFSWWSKYFRSPKLFYVTTVSSTSTISTTTICFVKSNSFANAACKKRRRRMLNLSGPADTEIQPSDPVRLHSGLGEDRMEDNLDDFMEMNMEENARAARFALYWKTTTLTSSTTTYTATSTLASLYCTPSVFAFSLCG